MSELRRHPIYRSITRPQMFWGVTMNYFIINMMVSTIAFLLLSDMFANAVALVGFLLVPVIMHVIGYFACLREPRVFDLWITKVSKCPRVPNFRRWGGNSYAP
ncbi:MAG: VirB3 family type IV secretion system protein [Pseudomonadota bacterium]